MEQKIFISHLAKFATKIQYVNRALFFVKSVRKIGFFYFEKESSISSTIINDILYITKAKINLFSLNQLNELGVNMKIISTKIYVYQKRKTIMMD